MIGPYIASAPSAPCHRCAGRIKSGARVYYASTWRLDDAVRTCADCVIYDLFGMCA